MPPYHPTAPLTGPDAWRGAALAASPDVWRRRLLTDELDALDTAADRLLAAGWPHATPGVTQPGAAGPGGYAASPAVADLVAGIRDELLFGRGFDGAPRPAGR